MVPGACATKDNRKNYLELDGAHGFLVATLTITCSWKTTHPTNDISHDTSIQLSDQHGLLYTSCRIAFQATLIIRHSSITSKQTRIADDTRFLIIALILLFNLFYFSYIWLNVWHCSYRQKFFRVFDIKAFHKRWRKNTKPVVLLNGKA